MHHSDLVPARRVITLDDFFPEPRTQLLIPQAIASRPRRDRNDNALADAKLFALFAWYAAGLGFEPTLLKHHYLDQIGFHEARQDEVANEARNRGFVEVWQTPETTGYWVRLSPSLFDNATPRQRLLSHDQSVVNEALVSCAGLKRLKPDSLMRKQSIYSGHKLIWIYLKSLHGPSATEMPLHHSTAAKYLGYPSPNGRGTIRDSAKRLAEEMKLQIRDFRGGIVLIAPDEEVYGLDELPAHPPLALVGYSGGRIKYVRRDSNGDETADSSPREGELISQNGDDIADSPPLLALAPPSNGGESAVSPPKRSEPTFQSGDGTPEIVTETGDETRESSPDPAPPTYVSIVSRKKKNVRTYGEFLFQFSDDEIRGLAELRELESFGKLYDLLVGLEEGLPRDSWDFKSFVAAFRHVTTANGVKRPAKVFWTLICKGKGVMSPDSIDWADHFVTHGEPPPEFDPFAITPEEQIEREHQEQATANRKRAEKEARDKAEAERLAREADNERRYGHVVDSMTADDIERLLRETGNSLLIPLQKKRPSSYRDDLVRILAKARKADGQ